MAKENKTRMILQREEKISSFWRYLRSSVFICGKNGPLFLVGLCVSVVALGSFSCSSIARDMGIEQVTDLQAREGPTGSMDNPTPLDPFKRYDLVLAANECRVFSLKLPTKWSWRVFLTVANRDDTRRGKLTANILPKDDSLLALDGTYLSKDFDLSHEGLQVQLGVGNAGEARTAFLQLCQDGAPLKVTLESQISATKALIVPGATPLPEKDP